MEASPSATLLLASELISRASVTPDDGGIIALVAGLLTEAGFKAEVIAKEGVINLWATHACKVAPAEPLVVLAGHCDVVPAGPLEAWISDPFLPEVRDGMLFGRGASDMKGPLAAMMTAAIEVAKSNHRGTIGVLITSDEEGDALFGTDEVLRLLTARGVEIDAALVGEPTSEKQFGDTFKVGRRGSLSCTMTVRGKQGHVAYPHLADNPIHRLGSFITELSTTEFDQGDEVFGPTTCQISNIRAGTGALNVIPGNATLEFNFRFRPQTTPEQLILATEAIARSNHLMFTADWNRSADAFQTKDSKMAQRISEAIFAETHLVPKASTGGGTSDARFFAAYGIPVIEFGPSNQTIHCSNECAEVADLDRLHRVYFSWLVESLATTA